MLIAAGVSPDHRAFAGLIAFGALCWAMGWIGRGWWAKRKLHGAITGNVVELRSRRGGK